MKRLLIPCLLFTVGLALGRGVPIAEADARAAPVRACVESEAWILALDDVASDADAPAIEWSAEARLAVTDDRFDVQFWSEAANLDGTQQ